MPVNKKSLKNLKKWKKGQSGNPKGGKPPALPPLGELMAETLGQVKNGKTHAQIIFDKLFSMALKGNTRAIEILMERGYGKAVASLNLTGADGGPLAITYTDALPPEFKETPGDAPKTK
ncbi:MAG: hypothetical protein IPJ01_12090 [Micavibrio sp.]|nr:hypothetical protein [Micavibrio sp.]